MIINKQDLEKIVKHALKLQDLEVIESKITITNHITANLVIQAKAIKATVDAIINAKQNVLIVEGNVRYGFIKLDLGKMIKQNLEPNDIVGYLDDRLIFNPDYVKNISINKEIELELN